VRPGSAVPVLGMCDPRKCCSVPILSYSGPIYDDPLVCQQDFHHPGLTNLFLVSPPSDQQLLFNDVRVLEAYHCTDAFLFLREERNNILASLTLPARQEVRHRTIAFVMGMCLAGQDETISEFTHSVCEDAPDSASMASTSSDSSNSANGPAAEPNKVQNRLSSAGGNRGSAVPATPRSTNGAPKCVDYSRPQKRESLLRVVTRAADISCAARNWSMYSSWMDGQALELKRQAQIDRISKLQPLPLTEGKDPLDKLRLQQQILRSLVKPLFSALAPASMVVSSHIVPQLENNDAELQARLLQNGGAVLH